MTRVLMQPKIYNLRLNIEQVHHTVDGWAENRKLMAEEDIDLYDSQMADIIDQFQSQGLGITIDLGDQEPAPETDDLGMAILYAQRIINAVESGDDVAKRLAAIKDNASSLLEMFAQEVNRING